MPHMYAVNVTALTDEHLVPVWEVSRRDEETNLFLRGAERNGRNRAWVEAARRQQGRYFQLQKQGLSRTDASAESLDRSMLVATTNQFRILLSRAGSQLSSAAGTGGSPPATLLDIGSGRGEVTSRLVAALGIQANQVTAMEASAPLRRQLAAAGYRLSCGFQELPNASFGVVSMLNVLDRCDDPRALLSEALRVLHPQGVLLVAVVLPFCAKVYEGTVGRVDAHREPSRPLTLPSGFGCRGQQPRRSFEALVSAFVPAAFGVLPLRVAAWTRVPYLCTGGTSRTYHHLDNALFALRRDGGDGSIATGAARATIATGAGAGTSNHVRRPRIGSICSSAGRSGNTASRRGTRALGTSPPLSCKPNAERESLKWLSEVVRTERVSRGWGDVLDSGLGRTSLCWLLKQPHRSLTGVTARRVSPIYGHEPLQALARAAGAKVNLLFGNWQNESLLLGATGTAQPSTFDVVLLDYLLAAVAMHWPYAEDEVLWRVLRSVKPHGGLALLTGIEPYDLTLDGRRFADDKTVLDIEAVGDAAALLANRRTYRELPMEWVLRQVQRVGGFRVIATKKFTMSLSGASLSTQLAFARSEATHVGDRELAQALVAQAKRLQSRLRDFANGGKHTHASSYAVVLERL